MIARIRKAMEENDKGFTLVELLVVIIIIGILAAIAIPVYLGQQEKARESTLKADLQNAKTATVAYIVEENSFPANFGAVDFTPSDPVTITYSSTSGIDGFCLQGVHADLPAANNTWHVTDSSSVASGACA